MKLSKAQIKVMEEAKRDIDKARNSTLEQWYRDAVSWWKVKEMTDEEVVEHLKQNDQQGYWERRYEEEKNGIALAHANTRTLRKLEEYGLIKIIFDSTGTTYGIDHIQVLNY